MDGELSTFSVLCAMPVGYQEITHPFRLKLEIQTENEVDSNGKNQESFDVKNFINVNYSANVKLNEGEQARMKLDIYLTDGHNTICSNQLHFSFYADDNKFILDHVMLGGIQFKFLFSIKSPSFNKHEFVSNTTDYIRYFEISQENLQFLQRFAKQDGFIDFTENGRTYTVKVRDDHEFDMYQYFLLDHPNILKVAGYTSINDGKLSLVFDCTGFEPIPLFKGELDFLKIMIEISSAMSYLHSLGFVHFELSPSDIFIDSNGDIKIFCFAANRCDDPSFTAPEIKLGSYDYRSDVYSVGVAAYFIAIMQRPNPYNYLKSKLKQFKEGMIIAFPSRGVQKIIRAMMADDPIQRPTFAEVILIMNSAMNQDERIELKLNPRYEAGDDYLFHLNSKSNIGLFHCLMFHRLHGNKDKEIEMIRHFQFPCDDFISYYSRYLTLSDVEIRSDEDLFQQYMSLDNDDYRFYLMPPPDSKYHRMKYKMNPMRERIDDYRYEGPSYHEMVYQMEHEMDLQMEYEMDTMREMTYNNQSKLHHENYFVHDHSQVNEGTSLVSRIYSRFHDQCLFHSAKAFMKRMIGSNGREMEKEQNGDILIVGDIVVEINKSAETVSIPQKVRYIGKNACEYGKIVSLDLYNTNIITLNRFSFSNCHDLKFISIPSSLEVIDEYSFYHCGKVEKIMIPSDSKLSKIGFRAFSYCSRLKEFIFPHMLKYIGDEAFEMCDLIKVFDLRETKVDHIGTNAFRSMFVKVIMLPSTISIASIINCCGNQLIVDKCHQYAKNDYCGNIYLYNTLIQCNKKLNHVLIRRGIEKISAKCFYRSKVVSLTIPASVVLISECAFFECKNLKWIHFPKNSQLIEIQNSAFAGCRSLKNIKFPKSLQNIGFKAFNNCSSLESAFFPQDSRIESIDNFFYGTKIKHLSIPPSVRIIGDIFYGMDELKSIILRNDLFESSNDGKMILSKDGSELIRVINNPARLIIPESVRVIKKGAFYGTNLYEYFVIPATIEVIEDDAFFWCNKLKRLEFEAGSRLKFFGENGDLNSTMNLIVPPK